MKTTLILFAVGIFALTIGFRCIAFADEKAELQIHLKQAESYADKMDWNNAIKEYSAAISLDPNNEEAHFELGNCYKLKYGAMVAENLKNIRNKKMKSDEACQSLEKDIEAAENSETRKLLASALQEWEKTVALNDRNSQAHIFLATTYAEHDQFDKAEQEFVKVVALSPKYIGAYTMLTVIYEKTGRLNLAIDTMKKALTIDPKSELFHLTMGSLYVKAGMREQAQQEYSELEKIGASSFYLNRLRDLMK